MNINVRDGMDITTWADPPVGGCFLLTKADSAHPMMRVVLRFVVAGEDDWHEAAFRKCIHCGDGSVMVWGGMCGNQRTALVIIRGKRQPQLPGLQGWRSQTRGVPFLSQQQQGTARQPPEPRRAGSCTEGWVATDPQ